LVALKRRGRKSYANFLMIQSHNNYQGRDNELSETKPPGESTSFPATIHHLRRRSSEIKMWAKKNHDEIWEISLHLKIHRSGGRDPGSWQRFPCLAYNSFNSNDVDDKEAKISKWMRESWHQWDCWQDGRQGASSA